MLPCVFVDTLLQSPSSEEGPREAPFPVASGSESCSSFLPDICLSVRRFKIQENAREGVTGGVLRTSEARRARAAGRI